jgi:hypothetical protein
MGKLSSSGSSNESSRANNSIGAPPVSLLSLPALFLLYFLSFSHIAGLLVL